MISEKKYYAMLWRRRFFIMVVHHVPRVSANKAYKKNCLQEFPILLALNYYTFMCTCDFYRYEHIILQKEGISKHSGEQENVAIGWTVVTCLILNMELT